MSAPSDESEDAGSPACAAGLRSVEEWRTAIPCWMPATGWYEWQEFEGRNQSWKKPKHRLGPDIEGPFMLRALGQFQRGAWRCAFITQDAPPHIAPMYDRAPFPTRRP